jgi:hypothetical protein
MTERPDKNTEDDLEVVIEDDTPDSDRGFSPIEDGDEDKLDDDAEIPDLGARAKKRIDRLTAEKNDQRRKREAAEREAAEAAKVVQALLERDRQYQAQLIQYEGGFVNQAKGRVEAEILQAKQEFKAAFETGDADAMAEASDKLSRLGPQHEQYSRYKAPVPQEAPPPQQVPQRQSYNPESDQNLMAFMDANPWFRTDPDMTAYAVGLHQQAAMNDPESVGTPEYYRSISERVKKAFPTKGEAPRRGASPVSPVTRGTSSNPARKQVTLTASQVRLASRLGLTPKQYAESLLEMENKQ